MLTVLAAVLLAGLARYSLTIALQSYEAKRELQRRWGSVLLGRTIISRAPEIIARYEARNPQGTSGRVPAYPLVETVRLGELDFQLLMDDESRKLNVNRLYMDGGPEKVVDVFRSLGVARSVVRLRPSGDDLRAGEPFESWGQVFQLDTLPRQEHPADWLAREAAELTCWGDGRVHYANCSGRVLEAVARHVAGAAAGTRLVALREQNPAMGLDELLNRLALSWQQRNRLKGWLTAASNGYSLWIVAQADDRRWYELHVAEMTPDGSVRMQHFAW